MSQYDRLDVFMKMLEVMEKDIVAVPRDFSIQERGKITTIIERLEGTLNVNLGEEIAVSGDKFENMSNSVIATRGSIAKGIITVQERRGPEVAQAIRGLEQALADSKIPENTKQEALELLSEITTQAAGAQPSKTILNHSVRPC
jgi:hypothetical protein